jgi:pimeloyl-ACP methyl ester carboxylesterase
MLSTNNGVERTPPMLNLLFWLLGLLVLFFAAVYLNELVAHYRADQRYPMPGRLVDVGGHRLHIHTVGEGWPTVVLDAGLGESALTWAGIQPEIAKFSRVCSYDRAGMGWSDPGPQPRTYPRIAAELHTLLHNAGEKPPYVLVGHSAGGFTVRLFAQFHPDEVAGVVLVDPSDEEDEDWSNPVTRQKQVNALRVEIFPAAIGLYRLLVRPAWQRM